MIRDDTPNTIRGAAALQEALDLIGGEGVTDKDLAKVIVDNELFCRALVRFALNELASSV